MVTSYYFEVNCFSTDVAAWNLAVKNDPAPLAKKTVAGGPGVPRQSMDGDSRFRWGVSQLKREVSYERSDRRIEARRHLSEMVQAAGRNPSAQEQARDPVGFYLHGRQTRVRRIGEHNACM